MFNDKPYAKAMRGYLTRRREAMITKSGQEYIDSITKPALDTEEEWRYIEATFGANVIAGKFRIIADWVEPASSDELRALMRQIVSDHNAAIHEGGPRAYLYSELQHALKSQALLVEALHGLKRVNSHCYCLTWMGGEHEPECAAANAALKTASGLTE
jgi:hypothetical protein